MAAPSRRTTPAWGDQTPTIRRARVLLPLPLGPMSPVLEPGSRVNCTRFKASIVVPGGAAVTPSTSSLPVGRGRLVAPPPRAGGALVSRLLSRRHAWRAETKPRHADIPSSIGASARPRMMEAAIIMPGEICCSSTSQAPMPRMPTCTIWRPDLEVASNALIREPPRAWKATLRSCLSRQRRRKPSNMPIASSTSAWRRLLSTKRLDSAVCSEAFRSGPRDVHSVSRARNRMNNAANIAKNPNQGWIRKMTAMNTGAQGASKKASAGGLEINWRTVSRSRTGWSTLCRKRCKLPRNTPASTSSCTSWFKDRAMRAIRRCRTQSSKPKQASRKTAITVSTIRVSKLALVSTRSYICSIYTGATSISMLAIALNTVTPTKPLRQRRNAACNCVSCDGPVEPGSCRCIVGVTGV